MDGVLPLWKPAGLTSHDCVVKVRKLLKTKKVGHTGTLDPNVTGVLPICIGEATKVARYITDLGKTYIALVTLGISTTTEDSDGETLDVKPITTPIQRNELLQVLEKHIGNITQIPPMYSAVKVNGKKLYEYARLGIEVERPKRVVSIYELELLDDRETFVGDTVSFSIRIHCGKGTYIRTLAVTIGEMLGYPAHMSNLTRVSSGNITESDCITFDQLQKHAANQDIQSVLIPKETVLSSLPKLEIHDTLASRVLNGQVLPVPIELEQIEDEPIAIFHEGRLLAIYKKHPTKLGMMKPERVFAVS